MVLPRLMPHHAAVLLLPPSRWVTQLCISTRTRTDAIRRSFAGVSPHLSIVNAYIRKWATTGGGRQKAATSPRVRLLCTTYPVDSVWSRKASADRAYPPIIVHPCNTRFWRGLVTFHLQLLGYPCEIHKSTSAATTTTWTRLIGSPTLCQHALSSCTTSAPSLSHKVDPTQSGWPQLADTQ